MQSLNSAQIRTAIIVFALFLTAQICLFLDWTSLQNLASFIALFIAATGVYLHALEPNTPRIHWILISLCLFLWLLCDMLWFLNSHLLARPYEKYEYLTATYLLPMLGILCAACYYFYLKLVSVSERSIVLLDTTSVFLLLVTLFFSKIFAFDFTAVFENVSNFTAFAAIIINFLMLFMLLSELFSSNVFYVHTSSFLMIAAGIFFSGFNLYAYYAGFGEPATQHFHAYPLYLLPFCVMMVGAFYLKTANKRVTTRVIGISTGSKWLPFLAVLPLLVQGDFNSSVAVFVLFVLVSHALTSYYIKSSLAFKKLLAHEKSLHQELEKVMHERTNELTLANLRLQDISERDYLTGLGSRSFLMDSLQAMSDKLVGSEALSVYYLNIRHFKALNSAYGHEVGDKILKTLAKRLLDICQNQEIVARIGADEFIIVVKMPQACDKSCINFGEKIKLAVQENLQIERYHFALEAIVGVHIVTTSNKDSARNIIKNADRAMYHAKENPAQNPMIYSDELDAKSASDARLETALKEANLKEQMRLVFEPVFELKSANLAGAQASLRWQSELGELDQSEFITGIKNKDTLNEICEFALASVLAQLKIWRERGLIVPKISLNITSKQALSEAFTHILKRVLTAHGPEAGEFELEFDEMIWAAQPEVLERIFTLCENSGIDVCIDDFGVGYSSLVFIKKYNIDRIKIARELVLGTASSNIDEQIVAAIINLGKAMGLNVTAKSVQNGEILDILKHLGCDWAQGAQMGAAMNAAEFEEFLEQAKFKKPLNSAKI